jgi:uracil-DNA glycosylase
MISSLRGTFSNVTFDNNSYYNLFVTFHPAYILRNHQYGKYEEDFKLIRKFLEDHNLYEQIKI